VAISIREGRLNSVTLLRRLSSNSRKNESYKAFREVGRSVRTVALLQYLADPALRRRVTAVTNKVEAYNGFAAWLRFGNGGVIADNDPAEQEMMIKFNSLLANCVIFHTALDMMEVIRLLIADGWNISAEDIAQLLPYITEHISRYLASTPPTCCVSGLTRSTPTCPRSTSRLWKTPRSSQASEYDGFHGACESFRSGDTTFLASSSSV
jgi:hypothetical protein